MVFIPQIATRYLGWLRRLLGLSQDVGPLHVLDSVTLTHPAAPITDLVAWDTISAGLGAGATGATVMTAADDEYIIIAHGSLTTDDLVARAAAISITRGVLEAVLATTRTVGNLGIILIAGSASIGHLPLLRRVIIPPGFSLTVRCDALTPGTSLFFHGLFKRLPIGTDFSHL